MNPNQHLARSMAASLFVSHGAPTAAIETGPFHQALFKWAAALSPRPRAVVVVSAHWTTDLPVQVSGNSNPKTIYDFYGFPKELYEIRYPATGSPALAREVQQALQTSGINAVEANAEGLDHGAWVPLRILFPDASVPVVQVSLPETASPATVFQMGRALRPLRKEGVMLLGSGSLIHNLRELAWGDRTACPSSWAREFAEWFAQKLDARDAAAILRFESEAPHVRRAHPTTEHFLPLLFTLGAATDEDRLEKIFENFDYGNLSMYSFALTQDTSSRL